MTGSGERLRLRLAPPVRLRTKIVVRIGLLVAALSIALGASTYYVVRDTLLDEREQGASEQFATNAIVLRSALRSTDVDEITLLASLRPQVRARELLFSGGEWYTASLQIQPDDLPDGLVGAVSDGRAVAQRFTVSDDLYYAIGSPLDDDGLYFEVFALNDLEATLDTLRNTLTASGVVATAAGMVVGWGIARRVTRPLEQVSAAAARIAAGDLGTRLDGTHDEDLARISSSFNRMADSLEARVARESRFAADVSHELRSPLTTLVNAVAVLERRRHELSADGQEALVLLAGDMKRFERMVSDLIEISKHDAGTIGAEVEYIAIGPAVLAVLRRSGRESCPLEITEPAATAGVLIDHRRFERSLTNVLDNAEAYGGGPTRITVDANAAQVWIAIDDQGPGVPVEERDRIFERFARGVHGERRSTADGSGLGLALARENVRILGGDLWVEDRPGGAGARFVVRLSRAVT